MLIPGAAAPVNCGGCVEFAVPPVPVPVPVPVTLPLDGAMKPLLSSILGGVVVVVVCVCDSWVLDSVLDSAEDFMVDSVVGVLVGGDEGWKYPSPLAVDVETVGEDVVELQGLGAEMIMMGGGAGTSVVGGDVVMVMGSVCVLAHDVAVPGGCVPVPFP